MNAAQPLTGIVVVELGHSLAGPYAGRILAGLSAEVIKVENPDGGDYARDWGPPWLHGTSSLYQALNRDKKGVAVDLGDEADCARLRALVLDRADVFLQNLRAGAAVKKGLGATELLAAKTSLIYYSLGAFGAAGPLADRPGYDPLMQASGGVMSVTGEAGGAPVRVGTSMIDMGAGMWAVNGVLAALHRRAAT
ncbi:MAG: CoA transferase, partial [Alphaproteobacteria bacterium]|nr:CoA transferase [Alphaproteobacteria bacterium]